MEKLELLKSIVNSEGMAYSLHKDIPEDERKLIDELEDEEYLYRYSPITLKPTEKGVNKIK